MRIESIRVSNNVPACIAKVWEQLCDDVRHKRAVRDNEGKILSHNAYMSAYLGHNEYTTCIELRAENDHRILAEFYFDPVYNPLGFYDRYRKPVTIE